MPWRRASTWSRRAATELVETFYAQLFVAAPAVQPLFAHTDMQRQRAMLLAALVLLRKSLRDLEGVTPTLRELGARHVAYGARPEHYPVVGSVLIGAMADVAGEAWEPRYTEAWGEAFGVVAARDDRRASVAAVNGGQPPFGLAAGPLVSPPSMLARSAQPFAAALRRTRRRRRTGGGGRHRGALSGLLETIGERDGLALRRHLAARARKGCAAPPHGPRRRSSSRSRRRRARSRWRRRRAARHGSGDGRAGVDRRARRSPTTSRAVQLAEAAGLRSAFAFPLAGTGGAMEFFSTRYSQSPTRR